MPDLPNLSLLKLNLLNFFQTQKKLILIIAGGVVLLLIVTVGYVYASTNIISNNEILRPLAGDVQSEATIAAVVLPRAEEATPAPEVKKESASAQTSASVKKPPTTSPLPVWTFPGRGTPNNKFGMYINPDPSQITETAKLINSSGGHWGWVLIPIDVKERNAGLWQGLFNECRSAQLKPVLQLYTTDFTPNSFDFPGLAQFLSSLSWPTQHLYISVFNEMNATYYWGGRKAPNEYAIALNQAIDSFKAINQNFFIIPGGFNSSARSGPRYMDEEQYLIEMNNTVPGIFKKLDGWATHAYPQPEFSGDFYNPPSWYGVRDQIENYKWEREVLRKNFGVGALPTFITETGWAHQEGNQPKKEYKPASTTARYFDDAYRNHWLPDPYIVAIMPFIWARDDTQNFNWVKPDGTYYPQYDVMLKIPKASGTND